MLDGQLYGYSPVLKAFMWDGKTKYKVAKTEEDERERLKKMGRVPGRRRRRPGS